VDHSMPPITALLHTENDSSRLGRTLEMLLPCAEILIVDHHSSDATLRIAREYAARIVPAARTSPANHFLDLARHDWILCMAPGESITENLQATLFEWSLLPSNPLPGPAFSILVREQTGEHWRRLPFPETRLIPRVWPHWHGRFPAPSLSSIPLEGELLRFDLP
jgi:glycosyltransferase involved in cell wall biosynthesis